MSLRYLVTKPCVKAVTASRCVQAAQSISPTSEFLTAPDILDDSAVSSIQAVFNLPGHSWHQNLLPSVDLIRAILSWIPNCSFHHYRPMVSAEHTALPEIFDVAWHL